MCGRILMLLLFAANAHNILWVLGAVDEDKVIKHLNRMEMDQYMDILELKSIIYKILQGNDKITDRLEKVEKMEETLELLKMQVQENAFYIKDIKLLPVCERWLQTQNLNKSNSFSAQGDYFYFNKTRVIWSEARDWCVGRGMKMTILKTQSQLDAVTKGLNNRKAGGWYWLDASDVGHPAGQFRWVDGTLVDGTTWHNGTIYKYHGDWSVETCVYLNTGYARLSDEKCSDWSRTLCQVPAALTACL